MTVLMLVVGLGLTGGSFAQDAGPHREDFAVRALTSTWRVQLGGQLSVFSTRAAWAPQGLAGASIILEDTLGLEERTNAFLLQAGYRINRRHSLELSAVDLRRSATRILDGEVEWGDYVYRADGEVETDLDTRMFQLRWKYDFSDSDRLNAGFTLGLSTFKLGISLAGEARLEDDTGEQWIEGVVEQADVIAPVPVIGFFVDYALSRRWVVRFRTEAVDLSIGSHRGHVLQNSLSGEFAVTDSIGLGLSLGGLDLEYDSEEDDEQFGVDYRITSLGAHVSVSF